MGELVDALPQGAAELADLAGMFESVGLGEDSVRALLRLGDPRAAIDSCIRLNHWERCATGWCPSVLRRAMDPGARVVFSWPRRPLFC